MTTDKELEDGIMVKKKLLNRLWKEDELHPNLENVGKEIMILTSELKGRKDKEKELFDKFKKMINPENRVLVPDCPLCLFKITLLNQLQELKEKSK